MVTWDRHLELDLLNIICIWALILTQKTTSGGFTSVYQMCKEVSCTSSTSWTFIKQQPNTNRDLSHFSTLLNPQQRQSLAMVGTEMAKIFSISKITYLWPMTQAVTSILYNLKLIFHTMMTLFISPWTILTHIVIYKLIWKLYPLMRTEWSSDSRLFVNHLLAMMLICL